MNDFIVSALKYRPATFESVVGQPLITATLKNAIAQKHLAHAYLFCGPRGVGKTTCARIFAKTLNCSNIQDGTEPCNQCESCVAFNENRSYNIHELDAASNNGVDDIRQLIDQVRVPPQLGHYSIYIIDEVHMLTKSAFNAFLKTLEEPPKHAVFILATTEKHKIIPTILSRCQIFDFNRIRIEDIVNHLQYVANKEGVATDPEALNVIALKADGAMRDALSIFDQIVSFSGGNVSYEKTIENLNVLDYDYYFQMVDAMLGNRGMDTLLLFNEILENGFDAQYFLNGMATHLRDLLVSLNPQSLMLLEVGDSVKEKYQVQAKRCSADYLFQALDILNDCDMTYRASRNKRLHVELALLKLCNLSKKKITTSETEPTVDVLQQGNSKVVKQVDKASTTKPTSTKTESERRLPESPRKEEKENVNTEKETKQKPKAVSKTKIPSISIKNIGATATSTATNPKEEAEKLKQKSSELGLKENEIGEDSFTVEQATEALTQYIVENNLDRRVKATLTAYALKLDKDLIFLKVNNSLEIELLQRYQIPLENYWRKSLNNKNIRLKLIEPEDKDRSLQSMGDKDKLLYLISKNKSILKLKTELGLEFE
ncbi:DNA polymerase III tau subunit [Balneicella halophila]|uniref:DNA polymerase III subunit gamma/tau n=1 Tax=Balneicella halophila TaxID=1537566 RepID=A0A7L4UPT3_BALHA|nr:DNA polymerase III subunit gamma/tau [Balneicella halophila]PVX51753.1 DNA polymerase III tau subunit [Balneicella halophila]